ncbi:hypothetical protein ACFXGI_30650, partial [Streptomyces sp. NPDC059355]
MSESPFTGVHGNEAVAPDPEPAVVPAPRTGDRRAARRRKSAEAGPPPAAPTGRRRGAPAGGGADLAATVGAVPGP